MPRLLRSAVIYGPNAAAKSNLLKGLQALRWLVQNSSSGLQEEHRLPVAPFMLSTSSRSEPTAFEIMFAVDGTRFHDSVALTAERVTEEWLVAYPKGRPQRWFERAFKREDGSAASWFGPNFTGERKQREVWQSSTRANALFLSAAVQLNNEQSRPLFNWIAQELIVLAPVIDFNPVLSLEMLKHEETRRQSTQFMAAAGIDIDRLELREEEGLALLASLVATVPGLVMTPQASMTQKVLCVLAWPKASDGSDDVASDMGEESDGTRKLVKFAGMTARTRLWRHSLRRPVGPQSVPQAHARSGSACHQQDEPERCTACLRHAGHGTARSGPAAPSLFAAGVLSTQGRGAGAPLSERSLRGDSVDRPLGLVSPVALGSHPAG